jgi:hypothetical protein
LQCCWQWGYINDVLHKPPQEEVTWREIRRPGGPCQQSHIIVITNMPNPAMWQFIVEEATNNVVPVWWCMVMVMYEPSL